MVTMKIVVHQDRDTRKVINTGFEEQLIVIGTCSERRSYAVSTSTPNVRGRYKDTLFRGHPKEPRGNRYTVSRKHSQRKERGMKYRMKIRATRDVAIASKNLARLSVDTRTQHQDESIKNLVKNSVESSVIRLREPVLQFERSFEKSASLANISDGSSPSTEKAYHRIDSMVEIFKCRMCPSFAVPEVYECPSGHSVCEECYLVVDHCSLCPNESSLRRVLGMERIAACLKFPCRWQQRGCLELLGPVAWRNHVDSCRHAEVHSNLLALASASQVGNSDEIENEHAIDL